MGVSYKNFWSLNTDEAVVAGILRNKTKKEIEVLMPLNAQMKGVDLYLINTKTKKVATIQVKGSRAYEPLVREIREYGHGSAGWFFFKEDVVKKATADYFAFLIYVIEESKNAGRRIISPHLVLISTKDLKNISGKNKKSHGDKMFSYMIWVNPKTKKSFDFRDKKIDLSKYLDDRGIDLINKKL